MTHAPDADAAVALVRRARDGRDDSLLVDGFHALKHGLRFGADISLVASCEPDRTIALAEELAPDLVTELRVRVISVPRPLLVAAAGRLHPTGLLAVARRPRPGGHPAYAVDPRRRSDRSGRVLLIDGPRHEGNLGAVIRVAAAASAAGVLVRDAPGTGAPIDPWSRGVIRGAAGLHWAVPVVRVRGLDEVDGPLVAVEPDAGRQVAGLPDDAVLCLGGERAGLSDEVRSRSIAGIAIPMRRGVSSLNLATSAAVALYCGSVAVARAPTL